MFEDKPAEETGQPIAPHAHLQPRDAKERFLIRLLDSLWSDYRQRVPHVQTYERIVRAAGAAFRNDHIAFRTIAAQEPMTGIATLSRVFEALGYHAAGVYSFPDKHLASIHYEHPRAGFPKLFFSELRTWELPPDVRRAVLRTLASHRKTATDSILADLASAGDDVDWDKCARRCLRMFQTLPWKPPRKKDVMTVNEASQFGAWVMVHGYAVNHFTALVNAHGVEAIGDLEKTVAALIDAGVPMKKEIEGAPGSKLRQTATEAAICSVRVREKGNVTQMPWTYAYFELAERGNVVDPANGQTTRFEGFLGPQATQLFEMTRPS